MKIKTIVYNLKRQYGQTVDLRNPKSDTDYGTGQIKIEYDWVRISHGIVLPSKMVVAIVSNLVSGDFKYGGYYAPHTTTVIVDGSDIKKSFLVEEKTEVIFQGMINILKNNLIIGNREAFVLTVTTLSSLEKVDE